LITLYVLKGKAGKRTLVSPMTCRAAFVSIVAIIQRPVN